MAWIQHLFVWLFIMSTTAYKCNNCFPPEYPIYDDQITYEQTYQNSKLETRSTEDEQLRTNERYPIRGVTQRIHVEERSHIPKIEDSRPRVQNVTHITNRRGEAESSSVDKIVFPGPVRTRRSFEPEVPEECKRVGICDSIPNYPTDHIANILSQIGEGARYFQRDELDVSDTPDIAQRLGPQEDNMELCNFKSKIMYPQAAPDKEGKWYTVVNSKNNPVQGFKVEICDTSQSSCAAFASFQAGYEARCVQKYVVRPMMALDPDGKSKDMMLKVPSCCSCVAKVSK